MMKSRPLARAGAILLAAVGLMALVGPQSASARDGRAFTSDTGDIAGHTSYYDATDIYTVYDDDADSVGVVGWIEIKQSDGSWRPFPRVYVGTGNGTQRSNYKDVVREAATVRIWACRQNGPDGYPFNCGRADVSGS
ncbi:MAG: hypothetical protein JWP57_4668 [Spirosoma sp.]|jgi:hypothetical protein|nr:hypothetical protein [Friedmanniella sp.]MDB5244042.1 hypothetical protein [Spirosoma sp.]